MTSPVAPDIKVTYYCPKPDLKRNLPKEKSVEVAEQILKLVPPKPIEPTDSDDENRFKRETFCYEAKKMGLMKLQAEYSDLAHAVDRTVRPKKWKQAINAYQIMMKNSPEALALQKKIADNPPK